MSINDPRHALIARFVRQRGGDFFSERIEFPNNSPLNRVCLYVLADFGNWGRISFALFDWYSIATIMSRNHTRITSPQLPFFESVIEWLEKQNLPPSS